MKVLDSTFLIDYEHEVVATAEYLESNADQMFVLPSTVYAEYLLGEANAAPEPNLADVRADIDWASVWTVTRETVDAGLEAIADLPASAPHFDGVDATVVGVSEEAGAPIVASDGDFTHPDVIDSLAVEVYR